jgi:eukaryotic-like serine/threonine-protein kinase
MKASRQMDYISKDALIQAMTAWVLDKSKPIGQILLDQKALSDDTHQLLETLVQKHLALHGNNPEKSLATVSNLGSVSDALRRIFVDDSELSASLSLTGSEHFEIDPNATASYSAGLATSGGQRFRILRPHAKGGLGEVFVAEDNELHREVALKEIQHRHLAGDGSPH